MPEYVFSLTRIRGKSEILSIGEKKRVKQNPYSGVFYAENLLAENIK